MVAVTELILQLPVRSSPWGKVRAVLFTFYCSSCRSLPWVWSISWLLAFLHFNVSYQCVFHYLFNLSQFDAICFGMRWALEVTDKLTRRYTTWISTSCRCAGSSSRKGLEQGSIKRHLLEHVSDPPLGYLNKMRGQEPLLKQNKIKIKWK